MQENQIFLKFQFLNLSYLCGIPQVSQYCYLYHPRGLFQKPPKTVKVIQKALWFRPCRGLKTMRLLKPKAFREDASSKGM